jgi:hypothetical protein
MLMKGVGIHKLTPIDEDLSGNLLHTAYFEFSEQWPDLAQS